MGCPFSRKFLLMVKTMSKSMDVFYKRSSVSAFRIAALMQVLYKVEGKKSEKEIRKLPLNPTDLLKLSVIITLSRFIRRV